MVPELVPIVSVNQGADVGADTSSAAAVSVLITSSRANGNRCVALKLSFSCKNKITHVKIFVFLPVDEPLNLLEEKSQKLTERNHFCT